MLFQGKTMPAGLPVAPHPLSRLAGVPSAAHPEPSVAATPARPDPAPDFPVDFGGDIGADKAPPQPALSQPPPDLLRHLLARRDITVTQMLIARRLIRQDGLALTDILRQESWITTEALDQARLSCFALRRVDLAAQPPNPQLSQGLDPAICLRHSFLPWQMADNGTLLIATARPEDVFSLTQGPLAAYAGARMVLVSDSDLQAAIAKRWQAEMTIRAATRVPDAESCRNWGKPRSILLALAGLALVGLVLAYPKTLFVGLTLWALVTLIIAALHKTAALAAFLLKPRPEPPQTAPAPSEPPDPVVSILAPMYHEPEVADHLIRRLSLLTYPTARLDIILVLEETDTITAAALAQTDLPTHMRVVTVPDGQPRTKPRAMNYALDFCRGDIIGIYDAEDAPDRNQIEQVVARFARAPPDVVCLQGVLDYYNPRQNWLSRCFTIEYATWFRVLMPGMARLGFAIPLGGTTLFFRRPALEALGGWDAHNVTEDADLGFRLARHGLRTEMIATTTQEEANCHILPWIRQRSRWLKGYMVTYLVHMRRPLLLLRQLGPWRFIGYQTHFITALSQFLLAPVLWSFWLIVLGLPHPLNGVLSPAELTAVSRLFLMVEALTLIAGLIAVRGPQHRHLLFWVASLPFYFPLGVFAAYKALWELVFAPFYWDKTAHGHSQTPRVPIPHS